MSGGSALAVPTWWELVRALWPAFAAIGLLAITGILLGLKSIFATVAALDKHDARICTLETFRTEQVTALGILPSRQDLGSEIKRLGEKLNKNKDELGEQLSELGERLAGNEARLEGIDKRGETTNQYLHTLIERTMRP